MARHRSFGGTLNSDLGAAPRTDGPLAARGGAHYNAPVHKPARPRPFRPPDGPDPERGLRRPLSNVRGSEERSGDEERSLRLAQAFRVVRADETLPIRGLHGLHPYPARLHPAWARKLLASEPEGTVVYDPFCGSGTVLVEARRRGLPCAGSDLSDYAVRVARLKTTPQDGRFFEALTRAAVDCHADAAERRETPFAALAAKERRFAPHVLAQLISLRDAIETRCEHADPAVREWLLLAFAPLLAKFANKDNRRAPEVNRRAVRDHFLRRVQGMVEAWADEGQSSLEDAPEIKVADAQHLPRAHASVDLILSSPPYPGVYDYLAEVRTFARWIGDDAWIDAATEREIGRRGTGGTRWRHMMRGALLEMSRILRPGGRIQLVVGDGASGQGAVRVDEVLTSVLRASDLRLKFIAAVSQERPHFHAASRDAFAETPRREHLVELERLP